jgi:hypothetical protein
LGDQRLLLYLPGRRSGPPDFECLTLIGDRE